MFRTNYDAKSNMSFGWSPKLDSELSKVAKNRELSEKQLLFLETAIDTLKLNPKQNEVIIDLKFNSLDTFTLKTDSKGKSFTEECSIPDTDLDKSYLKRKTFIVNSKIIIANASNKLNNLISDAKNS
jgi:hypothetical protein